MPGLQIYTRDVADYFASTPLTLFNRENTLVVVSIAQLQKLAQHSDFKTAITYTMGLPMLCGALAELTSTHKAHIITQQGNKILLAVDGKVLVTELPVEPDTWRLKTAVAASIWWLQNPSKPLEAIATGITQISWE